MSLDQIAERLRAMEELNRKLAGQLEANSREHAEQLSQLRDRYAELSRRLEGRPATAEANEATANVAPGESASPVPDYTEGSFTPFAPAPGYPASNMFTGSRFPLTASFGPGFRLQSEKGDFSLNIHYESQVEYRNWSQDQLPANDGFFLPRQRIFFDGNLTKTIEYEFAINRGLNNINLLNAYLNFHFDDRLQLRMGRFFTPLPYEQYAVSNYWLLTPERSVFTSNLSLNRQVGAMAWGYLFDEQLDYAAGVFNGSRNSFESLNNSVDFVGYLNARPFQKSDTFQFAKFWNVGTSVAYGRQDQSPVPVTFRIAGGSPDTNIPGPATTPFLVLNNDVTERGERVVGSVHSAYFYKSLSLLAEWQYGFGNYASPAQPDAVRVPYSGFYVAGGYFLTGEEIERRTRLKPLRPLIPVKSDEQRGIGAWEFAGRVAQLKLGDEVFQAGFADANTWSNSVVTTELGVNWYWNEYIKMYMFWLHGDFGDPVQFRPGQFQKSADMLWLRCQLYF
ncbi:MAG: OprO/OprP family phosphate-selective porin [Gemmataceae bacterium]|nr:OprO/OprP family phosphate-selective porin [Gemmataceae bacterium]